QTASPTALPNSSGDGGGDNPAGETKKPAAPAITRSLKWYTATSLPSVNPLQTSISLTAESQSKGMVFFVVEFEIAGPVLAAKPEDKWLIELKPGYFKLHLADGSTETANGFKLGTAGFEPGSFTVSSQDGKVPEWEAVGAFFVIPQSAIAKGALKFQVK